MSSDTPVVSMPPPPAPVAPPTECEVVIEQRLRQTQRQVKGVDIAAGLVALAIGVLLYLLAAALVDHWLIAGGLGVRGRLWFWLGLLAAVGVYFVWRLLPMLLGRINPIFAAAAIEQSQPSLKNSLVNFLLLRGRRQEVAPPVYQAMEHRAAVDLAHVEVGAAVDQTHLIRLGYVLAAVVAVFGLYLALSPKNPIRSAARVLWPWSGVAAPTRVSISNVRPGHAAAFVGESVGISAEVAGLDDDEQPLLIYSTADEQTVDQSIPMTRPAGAYRYECRLPPGKLGLQQDYFYSVAAGDSRSERYRITVQAAPTIDVDKVTYHYPAYTGIADRTVERQGDLRAIEGTEATLHAAANAEIRPGTAEIDLGCTGRRGVGMSSDGRTAVGRFTLRLDPNDPSRPEYDSYQIRFFDAQGRPNVRPIPHRIEVIRDLPPSVELLRPQQENASVPVNGKLDIAVRAEDPDFGLRRVAIRARHNGRSLLIKPLLEKRMPAAAWPGEFSATYAFEPARLGLRVGDRVEYWVEAEDNKEPVAGIAAGPKQWITVVDAESATQSGGKSSGQQGDRADAPRDQNQKQQTHQQPENQSPQEQPPEKSGQQQPASAGQDSSEKGQSDQSQGESSKPPQAGDDATDGEKGQDPGRQDGGKSDQEKGQQQGEASDQKQGEGEASDQQQGKDGNSGRQQGDQKDSGQQQGEAADQQDRERIDPDTDPGGAMQEILKDRQQQQPEKQDSSKGGDAKPNAQPQQSPQGGEKAGKEQSGNEKTSGQESGGDQKNAADGSDQKNAADRRDQKSPAGDSEQKSAADARDGQEDQTAAGRQKPAGDKTDQTQPAQDAPAADPSGGQPQDGKADGKPQSQPGREQSGDKTQSGEPQPGEKPSRGTDQQPGDAEKSGKTQPGREGQSHEMKPAGAGEASGENAKDDPQKTPAGKPSADSQGQAAADPSGNARESDVPQADRQQQREGKPDSRTPDGKDAPATGEQAQEATGERDQKTATDARDQKSPPGGRDAEAPGRESGRSSSKDSAAGRPEQPGGGGKPGTSDASPPESSDPAADEANLAYARAQTALALEHLRDQLAKEKPALLDQLGWTKDDARRFLDRWEQMQRAAAQPGPEGDAAREHLDDTLRSLGLRRGATELRRGAVAGDQSEQARDAARFAPPPEWAEQFREYTRGVAGEQK